MDIDYNECHKSITTSIKLNKIIFIHMKMLQVDAQKLAKEYVCMYSEIG